MASDESGPNRAPARDTARIVLVVCCLLAIVLAGVLVPSLTSGVVDSPAESLLPGKALESNTSDEPADLGNIPTGALNGSGSGFGALNPGTSTNVGGSTGAEDRSAFQSQNDAVHFTVTSPRPAYWRTGAYDEYTGSGWAQTGEPRPLDGPLETDGIQGSRVQYEVALNRTAQSLPTVWRPNTIVDRSDLQVTDQRAIRATEPLEPGETYVGVSHQSPQDPSVLETSGTDYPSDITERYGTLSDKTPERVEVFTDSLTRDDATPYEKAQTIEQWLESTKRYSLNASRTSEQMADTFIFEMDQGYCEYFATAMTVMLRSQDIPARYVVGYSTGQQTAENTYSVRALNAHAWVEVYFEDVGWVKFDPTPGGPRLQQEQQSMQEQDPDADYSPQEQGSPGETLTPDGESGVNDTQTDDTNTTDDPDDNTTDDTDGQTDAEYDVSLNRTAVPGVAVEVSVMRDDEPAVGVRVLFNGESIGTTDTSGTVVGTVPYARELNVTLDDGSVPSIDAPGDSRAVNGERFYSVPPPRTGRADVIVPVETNATLTITGDTLPGSTVTVSATVADVPVRDAAVLVDGAQQTTTDGDGRAQVELPARSGNVTIAVERDPVSGAETLTLPELNVSVTPNAPIALPLTTATVEVSAGGDPVTAANVSLDGTQVTTTDINGTATVELPIASSATVSISAIGLTRERTISGLFVNLGLVAAAVVLLIGLPVALGYWRGYTPRDIASFLRRLPTLTVQYAKWILVTLATRGDELLARLGARLRATLVSLVDLVRGNVSPGALWAALLAWVDRKRAALRRQFASGDYSGDGTPTGQVDADRRTIRAAWATFLGYVSLPSHRTKTPGEIARHAVHRDGLPAKPVRVLRDTFREVEYGARSASERLERVEQAITALEREREREREDGGEE